MSHVPHRLISSLLFQFTFPRGERHFQSPRISLRWYFNPRSRVGNKRRRFLVYFVYFLHFNPRSRVGNDVGGKLCVKHFIISIHVPAWGTTVYVSDIDVGIMHFNPRSRVGNDVPVHRWAAGSSISIHVPAWGTTSKAQSIAFSFNISIHVPAWGTTFLLILKTWTLCISIHVPAWGTTGRAKHIGHSNRNFNPRSRVGND